MKIHSWLLKILSFKPVTKTVLRLADFVYLLKSYWPLWRDYVLAKLLTLTLAGLLLAYVTWQKAPYTSKPILISIVLTCSAGAVTAGYIHWKIDERNIQKRTLAGFESPPLSQFLENGFDHRFNGQLWGMVNNYTVILTPMHGRFGEMLTIRIPVSTKKNIDEIIPDLTPYFSIVEVNFVMMAKADIENYLNKFNYFELMNMITQATEKIQQLNLEPFEFSE